MQRIALGVEYRGSAYHGWQMQKSRVSTVEFELQKALSAVANHPVKVICAGRTDAGVHATGQVVHFDTEVERSSKAWTLGANTHLPKDITVKWAASVTNEFHARFSATLRRYRYVIYNEPTSPAILSKLLTWVARPLDAGLMHQASQAFLGEHDFSSFRAAGCQANSPVRSMEAISVKRVDSAVIIDIAANAFLHHMVRNIVGVLLPIGFGVQPVAWAAEVLNARDRQAASVTAPADGLYLMEVSYPSDFTLPKTPTSPLFI